MKGNGWQLRRSHVFGLSVLILAGGAFLVKTSGASEVVPVHPFNGEHVISIDGQGEFSVASEESIAADDEGRKYIDRNGLSTLPIRIFGMAGRGYSEGVGETMYWLDKSRPVEGSMIREKVRGTGFPAIHEMHFHLLLTTEALPGRTFRSINPAVMVNNKAMSFPPKPGALYALKNVVELEDVNEPGVVVVRILSNRNQMVQRYKPDLNRRMSED